MEIGISALIILILIILGTPVNASFLAGSFIYLFWSGTSLGSVAGAAFFALEKSTLLAIPLFMLAGKLMEKSGIADRLIDLADAMLIKVKGGMGATIPMASMLFGAVSGSGTATVSSLSNVMLTKMTKMGWDKRYIATMLACSASLGFMIPPNMNAILFSSVADVSIAALFMATLIPGVIWGASLILVNRFVYAKWYHPVDIHGESMIAETSNKTTETVAIVNESYWSNLFKATLKAIPAIVMVIIIFGGIYGGIFSPTEAGAVAGVYALILGILYRTIGKKNIFSLFRETGQSLGSFMIILPMVHIFSRFLVLNQVPQTIAGGISSISSNPIVIMILIDLILVVAGMFLDAGILILVITPMLIPTANMIGMNLIQLAVIMFVCVGIGTVTPPMAFNLFIASKASDIEVVDMMTSLKPLLLLGCVPILLLVTFIPELSLWLPRLLGLIA
ncbi:C4-dicarboxylate transporter, DctM subunit [Anaerovirgula multivorans]|uniref:C4-dicarboxylate transporter, DctM subunit n=1 Tax=Anaerovirgula multivorans TaxID=312168 RepID=A0A239K3K1_9FIRM|nr:TRAP transporter large permease [Anaerovirgula multivorans]SNT12242.1 C4-dicarboxylate transporter, DctM subunit [Anaerovirgula multivorans]